MKLGRLRIVALSSIIAALVAAPAQAQDSQCRNLRFRSHFRLNGAQRYLEAADRAQHIDAKRQAVESGLRVLGETAASPSGADPATMWYFFGRFYQLRGDAAGADSAFTRAADLMTDDAQCRAEITRLRRNMWIPLQNQAVAQLQVQQYDSAIATLRQAHQIYRDDPSGYMNMASAFMSKEMYDSAAAAFRLASRAGDDPSRAELRQTAMFNAARLYTRAGRHPAAESAYRDYIRLRPRDVEGATGLAASLTAQGRTNEATAVYDSLLRNADSLSSFDLFDMGVALFRAAMADTADAARQRGRFQLTARAFETGLQKNPTHRDALFNLTNSYLAANDTVRVLDAARRLAAVDSLNRQSLTLLARAAQMNRQQQEVVRLLQRRDSLPMEIAVQRFEPRDSTVVVRGVVQNLQARERAGFVLTLEFLNGRSEVVATERVDVPTLGAQGGPGAMYDFNLTVNGRGVVTYRYRL